MPGSKYMDIGTWVKQLRKNLDLTQVKLAEKIHCSPATIKKLEQNKYRPSKDLAERLIQHLHVPFEEQFHFMALVRGLAVTSDESAAETGVVNLTRLRNPPVIVETTRGEIYPHGFVYVGEVLTVRFTIRNSDVHNVRIQELVIGARGPGGHTEGWDAPNIPFPPVRNLVLQPGETYEYKQSRAFYEPGDYFVEPVFQDSLDTWHGIQPFTRISFFVVAR